MIAGITTNDQSILLERLYRRIQLLFFSLVTHIFFLSILYTHRFFFKHIFSSHHSLLYSLYNTHGCCTPHKLRVVCPFHDGSFFPFMCIHTKIIHFLFHRIIFIPEYSCCKDICISIFFKWKAWDEFIVLFI